MESGLLNELRAINARFDGIEARMAEQEEQWKARLLQNEGRRDEALQSIDRLHTTLEIVLLEQAIGHENVKLVNEQLGSLRTQIDYVDKAHEMTANTMWARIDAAGLMWEDGEDEEDEEDAA